MRTNIVVLLLVIVLHIVSADHRQETYDALESLKDAQSNYNKFREYVTNEVSNAKRKSTYVLGRFHEDVLQVKELYLQQAIWNEEELLYQIDSQTLYPHIYIDHTCLGFSRVLVENNMNVAGVEFTNCVLDVDALIKVELADVLADMQQDGAIASLNILDSMNRTNIITHPEEIVPKIQKKLQLLEPLPNKIISELNVSLDEFDAKLGVIGKAYRACLMENDSILKAAFDNVKSQLVQICKGRLI